MARTALTVTTAPGGYSNSGVEVTWDSGDPTNDNKYTLTGAERVLVKNTSGAALDCEFISVDDPYSRDGDFTVEIPAGKTYVFGPFPSIGWRQTDGCFYLNPESADLEIAIVK